MTSTRPPATVLWTLVAAALLAGLAWLLWGDYLRPHEPVRVISNPPGEVHAAVAGSAAAPGAMPASASAAASPGTPLAQQPLPSPPAPASTAPASAVVQDPLAAFRRAIEEAQAQQAQQGGNAQPAPRYTSLPEAIEAARRAQQQASAPQPAPGAGLNPFGASR